RTLSAQRRSKSLVQKRIDQACVRVRGRAALQPFLPHRGSGLRHGGHRLGTQAILRKNMRLNDKVALITGAGSGIGREAALLFAKEGAAIVVVDVNDQAARDTAALIDKAIPVRADVSKASDCQQMVEAAEKAFGKLNVLFNNAGIMHAQDDDAV